jgi:LysM repeat protein
MVTPGDQATGPARRFCDSVYMWPVSRLVDDQQAHLAIMSADGPREMPMHRAWTGVFLTLAVVLSSGCVSEEPARTATPISSFPTLARPPLTTPSVSPSLLPSFPSVPSGSPSVSATAAGQSYTVQSGDTLSSIAERFYGSASQTDVIFQANRDQMSSPGSLSVGMVLRIPPRPPTPTTQGTPQR